jgi:hypothetical protein
LIALAISPSSSFTLFFGSAALTCAGEAERAIDWAERSGRAENARRARDRRRAVRS